MNEHDAVPVSAETLNALVLACKSAYDHTSELREAWQRGVIDEHDGQGGRRSNRNVDVNVQLRDALAMVNP